MAQGGLLARTPGGTRGLPRGRSRLPIESVLAAQRERMLRAVIAAVADHGYADTTVAEIVRRARVSRSSFYLQWADKEECFFDATAEGRQQMFAAIARAVADQPTATPDVDLLRAGLRAFLRFLRDEPAFATVFYLELAAVGRRGGDRLAAAHEKLAARTAVWHTRALRRQPHWPTVPDDVYLALTGATEELVRDRVRRGQIDALPELEDVIVDMHLRLLTAARD